MDEEQQKKWIVCRVGSTIVALQHCCGVSDAPVNCFLDQRANWECPNCMTTYGAHTPLERGWSVETIFPEGESD